jgi:hypothetical protein
MALVKCSACGSKISTEAVACPKCGHPRSAAPSAPARKKTSTFTWIVVGLFVLGFISKCQVDRKAESQIAAEQARRAKLTPEQLAAEDKRVAAEESKRKADAEKAPNSVKPTSDNILDDATFLKEHPDFVPTIRELIERSGYECPAVHLLWPHGESPYGPKLEAICGPPHSQYPNTKLHYAVYPKRLKVNLCSEFGAFSDECS